ncbi:SMC familyC-terminal domain containing protein, partial [Aphelenchoides avenae]
GEVEQISLMKPKAQTENDEGMLEYLEDIIGSSRLKAPIAKVERRLETLQQQRSGQLVRVKYAEKEKLDLEGPVKELIEQLRVDNAIAHVNYQIYSSQKLKTQDEIAALQPGVDELRDQRSECKDQLKEVLTTLAERKEACKELQKRFDDAQERHERVKTEFNEQKQTISKADADVKRLEEKRTKVEEEIGREEKKIAEYEKAPEVGSEKVRKLKVTLEQCERTIAENSAEMQPRLALVEEQTAGLCEKKKTTEVELQKLTAQEDKIGGEVSSSRLERVMTMSLAGTRARGARAAAERRGRAAPQAGGDQGLARRRRAERRSEDERALQCQRASPRRRRPTRGRPAQTAEVDPTPIRASGPAAGPAPPARRAAAAGRAVEERQQDAQRAHEGEGRGSHSGNFWTT